jgi:hypothetical protein
MLTYHCIDPNDQYGEAEVLVEFDRSAGAVRLISVIDASYCNILPDLEEVQQQDLQREISDAFHEPARMRAHDGIA